MAMSKTNRNIIIFVVIALVLLIVGFGIWYLEKKKHEKPDGPSNGHHHSHHHHHNGPNGDLPKIPSYDSSALQIYCFGNLNGNLIAYYVQFGDSCATANPSGAVLFTSFKAFNSSQPDTIPFCVSSADNKTRFQIIHGKTSCDSAGWTPEFVFYAYKKQYHGTIPMCLRQLASPTESYIEPKKTSCPLTGWTQGSIFYVIPLEAD